VARSYLKARSISPGTRYKRILLDIYRVTSAVQQIMTELIDTELEEDKIVSITKTVLKRMSTNGH